MKLRIRGSSIRLRLTQAEVMQFADHGRVEDRIAFGSDAQDRLVYVLQRREGAAAITARLESGVILVTVPTELARRWTQTETIGLEGEQSIGGGRLLRILIEKDFACLQPRPGEVDDDAFPNPKRGC